jgi:hypothetical protein
MNQITNLTPQQLRKAADLQERIQSLQRDLTDLLGGYAPASSLSSGSSAVASGGKRRISAAGIARIRAAQRLRWARIKAAQGRK